MESSKGRNTAKNINVRTSKARASGIDKRNKLGGTNGSAVVRVAERVWPVAHIIQQFQEELPEPAEG